MKPKHILLVGALLIATLSSCVAPKKDAEERDANGNKIEYVYYTPTGSHLPIRVRKDQLKASDKDTAAAENALLDMQRNGAKQPSGPGG